MRRGEPALIGSGPADRIAASVFHEAASGPASDAVLKPEQVGGMQEGIQAR